MAVSKISVDLKSMTFSMEVPDERIEAVLERIEGMFKLVDPVSDPIAASQEADTERATIVQTDTVEASALSPKKRGKSSSRIKAWDLIDLGLSGEQRQELREFYQKKNPKQQNESVAVISVKLKKFLGRSSFSGDEIHSAFKIVNQPTPRNLIAVFGNMKKDGRAGHKDGQILINSHTEDYVMFHMGAAGEKDASK